MSETELFVKISQQLGEISGQMKAVLEKLADHEHRLDEIEKNKKEDFKSNIISWLIKALIASIMVIGSLTGSASLIKGVLGIH